MLSPRVRTTIAFLLPVPVLGAALFLTERIPSSLGSVLAVPYAAAWLLLMTCGVQAKAAALAAVGFGVVFWWLLLAMLFVATFGKRSRWAIMALVALVVAGLLMAAAAYMYSGWDPD